jgi:hypothetical protein
MSKADEADAMFALSRLQERERLLKLMRGSTKRYRIQVLVAAVLFFVVILSFWKESFFAPSFFMIIPVILLFAAEAERQRRQINAIVEFLESEYFRKPNT